MKIEYKYAFSTNTNGDTIVTIFKKGLNNPLGQYKRVITKVVDENGNPVLDNDGNQVETVDYVKVDNNTNINKLSIKQVA